VASLKYRADIDGLRAIAVLPVLFFHTDLPGMSGGYVGVDVFFVISGYLITSILQKDMLQKRFSIIRFYERRVRRLWPALIAVVAFSLAVGWFILLPTNLKELGKSLVAVTVFSSNILFWRQAGYFDGAAELKPLLHTWSLAVEEQFYLFFPPFLLAMHRFAPKLITASFILSFIVSFGAAVLLLGSYQSLVFYNLPFRAWELLFGSLLAVHTVPAFKDVRLAHASGLLGLGLIGASVVLLSKTTPFPGLAALPPCLGTALVIHAGLTPGAWSARLLGVAPLVFVGKISYSLYLWHWPLIVFARLLHPEGELELWTSLLLIVVSFAAGAFSWRFIEQPFRAAPPKGRFTARTMFVGAAVVSGLWLIAGLGLFFLRGVPSRLSVESQRLAYAAEDFQPFPDTCGEWPGPRGVADGFCLIGDREAGDPTFFLWGDSHAGILVHGFEAAAEEAHVSGLFSNQAGCPAFFGVEKDETVSDAHVDAECGANNRRIREILEAVDSIDRVILVGRWAYYSEGGGVGFNAHQGVDLWRTDGERGAESNAEVFAGALRETVETLRAMGKSVYVVRQIPELEDFQAEQQAISMLVRGAAATDRLAEVSVIPRAEVLERQRVFEEAFPPLARQDGVTLIDTWGYFCDEQVCRALDDDGRPRYFDNNHVTTTTSRDLAPTFARAFQP
jgi:peptidoglycan/LPS O-acetylase OafA/YrhL